MAAKASICRVAQLPDPVRIARCSRAPELGPAVLFFSGGTALRPLSRVLKQYTHNSVHLITAFDSGGSSAQLRRAFAMPSIGDLRNRIVALADESVRGNPQIYRLFCHRFPRKATHAALLHELEQMVSGPHPLVEEIPEPFRQIARTHLRFFRERMPADFDLEGANVGNLMLAGGFLANSRDLDSVLFLFSQLLQVRGTVRPIVGADLHLYAELKSGRRIVGQHRMTGKEAPPIDSPIHKLGLVDRLTATDPSEVAISEQVRAHIAQADLICFPMGSFYSSVLANLLPTGTGQAIVEASCPRVYIPNTGSDSEQTGMSMADSIEALLAAIRRDAGASAESRRAVDLVILDRDPRSYDLSIDLVRMRELGVPVVQLDLVPPDGRRRIDPQRLTEALLSLT